MSKVVKIVATVAAIAAAIPTGGGSLTVLASVLGTSSLAASLIATGLTIGASLLSKRPKAPSASSATLDRLRANVDPRTPRKTVVGVTAMATDIRDEEFTDDQEYFHRFMVVASHEVESIDEIWFDDEVAWSASGGVATKYVGYLTVATRTLGSSANAINISARMGTTRRYTGLAYVHLRYKLTGIDKKAESPFGQSITTRITVRGKGALFYDPRLDSTVAGGSGSHRADTQSTWEWDDDACRNPALALLFYLLGWYVNGELMVGKGIPANRIDLASFAVAANICDEEVATEDEGTEPRYRCDGIWSEGDDPTTVIDMLKAIMNADLDDVDGKLRLTIFQNDLASPDASFDENDILDDFEWSPSAPLSESFNIVRGLYTDPSDEALYQLAEYPQVEETSPDGIDRIETVNLPLVQSPDQAQRLGNLRLQRQRYGGTFSANFQATAWKVQKNSIVLLTFEPLGFVDKPFRVAEMEIRNDGIVPLVLREENPAIYTAPTLSAPTVSIYGTPYDYQQDPYYQSISDAEAIAATLISPEEAVVSIIEGEPGNNGTLVVGHEITRDGTPLTGGTWSIYASNLGPGNVVVDDETGDVTLQNIEANGAYIIRYTDADGLTINQRVPVLFRAAVIIEPDNPVISIVENGPGTITSLVVGHSASQLGNPIGSGVWSIVDYSLGVGGASVNSGTGDVTIGSVDTTGYYIVRLTWNGIITDLKVPVVYAMEPTGVGGIGIVVTNEAHVVTTETDGTGGDFTDAGGQVIAYRGASPVSAVYSVVSQTPDTGWITIDDETGEYTVTDGFSTYARATLRATIDGVDYDRQYSIAKSRRGNTGFEGPVLRLISSALTMTFAANGSPDPSSQTITIEASLNYDGTPTWTAEAFNDAGSSLGLITLGGSGDTRTLTSAQFNANTSTAYVVVTATTTSVTDKIRIVRLTDGADGEDGSDGADALSGYLTNEAHVVAVDGAGNFSLTGAGGEFKVFEGTTDVTASCTFSIVGGSDFGSYWYKTQNGLRMGIDEALSGAGTFTLTEDTDWTSTSETFTLRATYGGATIDRVFTITKAADGADGADGTDGTDGTDGLNNATVTLYRRASSPPSVPSTTATYTFATGILTGHNNSWSQDVPVSDGNPLYTTQAVASSASATDTIASGEWSSPVILVQDGADGTDGTDGEDGAPAVTGYLTNEAFQVFAYANGNVVSYSGASGTFKIFAGNTDVSSNFALSTPSGGNPQSLTVGYSDRDYSVTGGFDAGEDTATLIIRATGSGDYSGVVIDKVFSLSKAKGGYEIVGSLPVTNLFEGRVVFLTTDKQLYRYDGDEAEWTTAVPASAITGQIVETQIDDDAITTPKLAANAVTANELAADSVTANAILAGEITGALLATTNVITLTAQIADAIITDAKITTLNASKINAGTIDVARLDVDEIVATSTATFSGGLDITGEAYFHGAGTNNLGLSLNSNIEINAASSDIGIVVRGYAGTGNSAVFLAETTTFNVAGISAATYVASARNHTALFVENRYGSSSSTARAAWFNSLNGPGLLAGGGSNYADIQLGSDGSASVPSLARSTDTDTGIYFSATNTLDIAAGGTQALSVNSTQVLARSGLSDTPQYSFLGDTDTGIAHLDANRVLVMAGGTRALEVSSSQVMARSNLSTTPQFSFRDDTDTGIAHTSANQMAMVCGGTLIAGMTTGGITMLQPFHLASGAPASSGAAGTAGQLAYDSSYFYVCVGTNSWRRIALSTF